MNAGVLDENEILTNFATAATISQHLLLLPLCTETASTERRPPPGRGCSIYRSRLYFAIAQRARKPSRQPIFFPSS